MKGGCQSGRKVVIQDSKSDLPDIKKANDHRRAIDTGLQTLQSVLAEDTDDDYFHKSKTVVYDIVFVLSQSTKLL